MSIADFTRRALRAGFALSLLLTLFPASRAFACAPSDSNAMETIALTTFYVEITSEKKSYRVGDEALILVRVTRPAHEDPAGLGVPTGEPPMSTPAEEVNVGMGVQIGDVYLPGYGKTDSEGNARIKLKLESWVRPGVADVRALAWNVLHQDPCTTVEEQGFAVKDKLFKVTR